MGHFDQEILFLPQLICVAIFYNVTNLLWTYAAAGDIGLLVSHVKKLAGKNN